MYPIPTTSKEKLQKETGTSFLQSAVLVSEKMPGEVFPKAFKQLYRARSIFKKTEGPDLALRVSQMNIVLYIS